MSAEVIQDGKRKSEVKHDDVGDVLGDSAEKPGFAHTCTLSAGHVAHTNVKGMSRRRRAK